MKANGALVVQAYLFLILALDEGEWLTSCPGHFMARKEPQDSRAGVDALKST